jgi:uncharacterized protein (TIGR00369 family)
MMTDTLTPEFEKAIHENFQRQQVMNTIGATLKQVARGQAVIAMPYSPGLVQQHGYIHAGIITAIVDSACGYAALTCADEDSDVLTVEYKVNLIAPARGKRFVATGRVRKSGRTLTICEGEVKAIQNDSSEISIALMLATMIILKK